MGALGGDTGGGHWEWVHWNITEGMGVVGTLGLEQWAGGHWGGSRDPGVWGHWDWGGILGHLGWGRGGYWGTPGTRGQAVPA